MINSLPNEVLENIFRFLPATSKQRIQVISTCKLWYQFGYAFLDYEIKRKLIDHFCDYADIEPNKRESFSFELKQILKEMENGVFKGEDLRIDVSERLEKLIAPKIYKDNSEYGFVSQDKMYQSHININQLNKGSKAYHESVSNIDSDDSNDSEIDEHQSFDEFSCSIVFPHVLSKINRYYVECCETHLLPDNLTFRLF